MSFITNGDEPSLWIVGKLPPWRQLAVTCVRNCGINPRILLCGYDTVLFYELQDPLFDAIFAPPVVANWQGAKLEIDGLIKMWTGMYGAATDYDHWFVDPQYYEFFGKGVHDQLRRIYALCLQAEKQADSAFDSVVTQLLYQALEKEREIIKDPRRAFDDDKEETGAYERASYLAVRLKLLTGDFAA